MTFCTDADLLAFEPALAGEAAFASQTLLAGTGLLSGSTFTISSGSLATSHVAQDMIIVLDGAVSGCYPIVSVNSTTALTLSALHENLPLPASVGSAADVPFAIRTFWPQRQIVSEMLRCACGADTPEQIVNPTSLKRSAALGTIQLIYAALSAMSPSEASYPVLAERYARMYRSAMRAVAVELDLNGDGATDSIRRLNHLELMRH